MVAGAVYRPAAEIVPTVGLSSHVTPPLEVPPIVAVYCWVWVAARVAKSGVSEIVTGGLSVTGAAYRPAAEIVPIGELSDQVTLVLALPSTVVESCCDPPARRFTELGDTDTLTVGCSVPKNKPLTTAFERSEERRVGKECRSR